MTITSKDTGAAIQVAQAKVDVGGVFGGISAYVKTGERWNGFALPYFTREAADRILEQTLEAPDFIARYDEAKDAYVFFEGNDFEEADVFTGSDFALENGEVARLYSIGAYMWMWEVQE
jgi:hypothetical protein